MQHLRMQKLVMLLQKARIQKRQEGEADEGGEKPAAEGDAPAGDGAAEGDDAAAEGDKAEGGDAAAEGDAAADGETDPKADAPPAAAGRIKGRKGASRRRMRRRH